MGYVIDPAVESRRPVSCLLLAPSQWQLRHLHYGSPSPSSPRNHPRSGRNERPAGPPTAATSSSNPLAAALARSGPCSPTAPSPTSSPSRATTNRPTGPLANMPLQPFANPCSAGFYASAFHSIANSSFRVESAERGAFLTVCETPQSSSHVHNQKRACHPEERALRATKARPEFRRDLNLPASCLPSLRSLSAPSVPSAVISSLLPYL